MGTELPGVVARLMEKGVRRRHRQRHRRVHPALALRGDRWRARRTSRGRRWRSTVRILEVDPIHRRIVLGVVDIPAGQERPAEPSKVHSEDEVPEIPADLDSVMED